MDLRSLLPPRTATPRTGGIVLASALLAFPGLVISRPGAGAVLLAASLVAALALLEGRRRAAPRTRDVPRLALVPSPARPVRAHPCARWELVERDGRRELTMRWS